VSLSAIDYNTYATFTLLPKIASSVRIELLSMREFLTHLMPPFGLRVTTHE